MNEMIKKLQERRSVREFTGEKVKDAIDFEKLLKEGTKKEKKTVEGHTRHTKPYKTA